MHLNIDMTGLAVLADANALFAIVRDKMVAGQPYGREVSPSGCVAWSLSGIDPKSYAQFDKGIRVWVSTLDEDGHKGTGGFVTWVRALPERGERAEYVSVNREVFSGEVLVAYERHEEVPIIMLRVTGRRPDNVEV